MVGDGDEQDLPVIAGRARGELSFRRVRWRGSSHRAHGWGLLGWLRTAAREAPRAMKGLAASGYRSGIVGSILPDLSA
jgi:hypothetical protein